MKILVTACQGPAGMSALFLLPKLGVHAEGIDANSGFPSADRPNYLGEIAALMRIGRFDYVLPCSDEEAEALAAFEDGSRIGSNQAAVKLCRDKWRAYAHVKLQTRVPVPRTSLGGFIKPRIGRGSRGTSRVVASYVVSEYLPGVEHTVDALCWNGEVVCDVVRRRTIVQDAISITGAVEPSDGSILMHAYVADIVRALQLHGPVSIQFKRRDDGADCFTEINPRLAGGATISAAAGSNILAPLPALLLGASVQMARHAFTPPTPGVYETQITPRRRVGSACQPGLEPAGCPLPGACACPLA